MKSSNLQVAFVALLSSALALASARECHAVVLVPSDLQPGDQYRLAFVTSLDHSGASSDINVFNDFVTEVANSSYELVSLNTSWKAIASTDSVDARDNTATNPNVSVGVPIYNLVGVRIANNYADLWDGSLIAGSAINATEQTQGRFTQVWTGTSPDGTGFLELGATGGGSVGGSNSGTSNWIWAGFYSSDRQLAFYGMSGVLTVVPEPGSIVLAACGVVALFAFRRLRKNR
jgi:hypothetical protein